MHAAHMQPYLYVGHVLHSLTEANQLVQRQFGFIDSIVFDFSHLTIEWVSMLFRAQLAGGTTDY
jgi:hypothetical protein